MMLPRYQVCGLLLHYIEVQKGRVFSNLERCLFLLCYFNWLYFPQLASLMAQRWHKIRIKIVLEYCQQIRAKTGNSVSHSWCAGSMLWGKWWKLIKRYGRIHSGLWHHSRVKIEDAASSGVCGSIYISTMKSTSGILWEFTTKKIVTNKDNKDGLIACSELDESEQSYSWQSQPKPFECKYIDFGMF